MMDDKPAKPHLSASQINTYNKCGELYRQVYIEGRRMPPRGAMIRGTAVHAGAELNFAQKVESHEDLPHSQVIDRAVDAVEQKVKHEGIDLLPEEKSAGKDKVVGDLKDSAVGLAQLLMTDIAPGIQPTGVEKKVRIELPGTRDLLAILDIQTKDTVEDFKTGARLKGRATWETDTQMKLYALTHRAVTGKDPKSVRVHELVASKKPKAVTHDIQFGVQDYEPLVRRINATITGIEAGNFQPAFPGAWWCSPKWCSFFDKGCPYVNGERKAAAEAQE